MGKSSIKYINQRGQIKSQNNSVVYGNFPKYVYEKSLIEKFNKFLGLVLFILVICSLVSYYFVSDYEKKMNKMGRDIVALTNENIELQNKLDNLHSFNKVETFIQNNTKLATAKNIIEIPAVYKNSAPDTKIVETSYKWSIGY